MDKNVAKLALDMVNVFEGEKFEDVVCACEIVLAGAFKEVVRSEEELDRGVLIHAEHIKQFVMEMKGYKHE
ncbi:MAG: hypothetical protein HOL31_02005 [Candidatus Scalindua sp.]|jgi:hypothetical protein|nr:hypothetical protein [Candidatus Scalindua sp.]MBT7350545.1 hypothetical protein [candidate division WWE3 bacterium]